MKNAPTAKVKEYSKVIWKLDTSTYQHCLCEGKLCFLPVIVVYRRSLQIIIIIVIIIIIIIIIIINCIYIAPIQNKSCYGALHKTELYNKFLNTIKIILI